jgi:hypothetical protein
MSSAISNVFSDEDMAYLTQLPEVVEAKERLGAAGSVYFKIRLTPTMRSAIKERLGLDLAVDEIPMRWIKGDMGVHIDRGTSKFEHTYLVYLNDSPGEFIVGTERHPIVANTAMVFDEGLSHMTQNTGVGARLLVGPMNEFAEPVGGTIIYYSNYVDAFTQSGNAIAYQGNTWILNDTINMNASISPYTAWRIASTSTTG